MKIVVVVFSIAWAIFSLINTGYEVLQPKWRERLRQSPSSIQANAGGIYIRGAWRLPHSGLDAPKAAVLFVDQEKGLLHALPLVYRLNPTYLVPLYNEPLTQDIASADMPKALRKTLTSPEASTIYYVGTQQTLDYSDDLLQAYTQTLIDAEGDLVFVILERKS